PSRRVQVPQWTIDPPSRSGTRPGSSPGAARLTTTTSVIYTGHINHNREEHIMPDITLKNGDISAYGLACGYVQIEPMGDELYTPSPAYGHGRQYGLPLCR